MQKKTNEAVVMMLKQTEIKNKRRYFNLDTQIIYIP